MSSRHQRSGQISRLLSVLDTYKLAFFTGGLFLIDLVVVDPIPFVDEILLAGLTLLLARWAERRQGDPTPGAGGAPKPPPKNVSP